jgi:diguanylate cyclase (GGDEF)-like protein
MKPPSIERLQAEIVELKQRLETSNESFLNVVGKNRDGILIISQTGLITYGNPAAQKLLGRTKKEILDQPFGLPLTGEGTCELSFVSKDGRKLTVETNISKIHWKGKPAYLASLRNITRRKAAEENLEQLSYYDHLTKLANKINFKRNLSKSLSRVARTREHFALIYLDLDDFKTINDTYGHDTGDQLLVAIAKLLKKCVRRADTVARLSGDEFAILLDPISQPSDAAIVAKKILSKVKKPLKLRKIEILAQLSIGIAIYPFAGTRSGELFESADAAMYEAKKNGKNQYQYFTKMLNEQAQYYLKLHTYLNEAQNNKELYLLYQPQVCLRTGRILGVEALLRWKNKEYGEIPPSEFIPVAEKTDLIVELDEFVVDNACRTISKLSNHKLDLAINLSIKKMMQANLAASLLTILRKNNFPASRLTIELTERFFQQNFHSCLESLKKLAQAGVQFSLDDYGSGYSSLSHLTLLPIKQLKIDKAFIIDVNEHAHDAEVVKATVKLAHSMGLKVVAEGVEDIAQLTFLKKNHCDAAQGFYLAKPMPLDELKSFVKTWQEDHSSIE